MEGAEAIRAVDEAGKSGGRYALNATEPELVARNRLRWRALGGDETCRRRIPIPVEPLETVR
jgi:hypothetical protein